MLITSQAATFRRLSIGEQATVRSYVGAADDELTVIDPRSLALVRLAALVMVDTPLPLYQRAVARALDLGVSSDEIIGVLLAIAPIAGAAQLVAAAPRLAMALGYDVEGGLAELDGS